MNRLKTLVIITLCLFFTTCGIEDLYYLPQVPENGINTTFNTSAKMTIPTNLLNSVDYSYATGYSIYYRIYFSNTDDDNINENIKITNNNYPGLSTDYNYLYPYTNSTDTTSITSSNTFRSRGYYELELENKDITTFLKSGGTFDIQFPIIYREGEKPSIEYNNNGIKINLLRSDDRGGFNPRPDKYFLNSDDLQKPEYANSTFNADVWINNNFDNNVAYVSMYIVAVGTNPTNFQAIFGKPTHIGIFKLTPSN